MRRTGYQRLKEKEKPMRKIPKITKASKQSKTLEKNTNGMMKPIIQCLND